VRLAAGALIALGVATLVLNAVVDRNREIARVRAESARFAHERDSIARVIEIANRNQFRIMRLHTYANLRIQELEDSVATLERARRDAESSVREIRKSAELEARLRETFPELAATRWGVTTVELEDGSDGRDGNDGRDTLGLEVFLVPLWFAETFIIDHQNAASWRAQKDRLLEVDSLHTHVALLQDSILRLEQDKSRAYEAGYHAAYTAHQDLAERYVAELKKPRFSLGSTVGLCLGAAGAGFLAGVVSHE